ncbi:hypothetical protein JCM16303_000196 [Sporobolomyces ruberrimus]
MADRSDPAPSEEETDDEIRVVWRTGPPAPLSSRRYPRPPTASHNPELIHMTPPARFKRPPAIAALVSPSAPGSHSERPERERKKVKSRRRRRGCLSSSAAEVPMDQTTLRLVSQLASKVQARSQSVGPVSSVPGKDAPRVATASTTPGVGRSPKPRHRQGKLCSALVQLILTEGS